MHTSAYNNANYVPKIKSVKNSIMDKERVLLMAAKGGRVIVIEGYGSWQVIASVNDHSPMLIWKALAELKG